MNFFNADLPLLKWSLLAFMFCLIIGGGAVWQSARYADHALKNMRSAQRQLIDAHKKLDDAESDRANMSIYARKYDMLVDYKIIGSEQRLDWMEELASLHQRHFVADFKYTIAPQQPYTPDPALDTGNFKLKLSGLSLQLNLLHEMQLIDFFDALRANIKGWFIIDHCTLERSNAKAGANDAASPSRLTAECAGGWITMQREVTP